MKEIINWLLYFFWIRYSEYNGKDLGNNVVVGRKVGGEGWLENNFLENFICY